MPIADHQVRMELTANSAVSALSPTDPQALVVEHVVEPVRDRLADGPVLDEVDAGLFGLAHRLPYGPAGREVAQPY